MTFSSTCCMVFIGLSTTDTSGGFHSLQFHETTDKQASIQYMSHNNTPRQFEDAVTDSRGAS